MKLEETEIFDTGLTHRGDAVEVGLKPSRTGGVLLFRSGMKKRAIPLAQILANVVEAKPPGVCDADWVELGALERRVAILALDIDLGDKEAHALKVALWQLVRAMRDERRDDRDLPPVRWEKG